MDVVNTALLFSPEIVGAFRGGAGKIGGSIKPVSPTKLFTPPGSELPKNIIEPIGPNKPRTFNPPGGSLPKSGSGLNKIIYSEPKKFDIPDVRSEPKIVVKSEKVSKIDEGKGILNESTTTIKPVTTSKGDKYYVETEKGFNDIGQPVVVNRIRSSKDVILAEQTISEKPWYESTAIEEKSWWKDLDEVSETKIKKIIKPAPKYEEGSLILREKTTTKLSEPNLLSERASYPSLLKTSKEKIEKNKTPEDPVFGDKFNMRVAVPSIFPNPELPLLPEKSVTTLTASYVSPIIEEAKGSTADVDSGVGWEGKYEDQTGSRHTGYLETPIVSSDYGMSFGKPGDIFADVLAQDPDTAISGPTFLGRSFLSYGEKDVFNDLSLFRDKTRKVIKIKKGGLSQITKVISGNNSTKKGGKTIG
jgi:hypothetical protein